jgi:hypothetical protein
MKKILCRSLIGFSFVLLAGCFNRTVKETPPVVVAPAPAVVTPAPVPGDPTAQTTTSTTTSNDDGTTKRTTTTTYSNP